MSKTELRAVLEEFEDGDLDLARQLLSLRQQPGPDLTQRIQAIPQQTRAQQWLIPGLAWSSVVVVMAALLFVSPPAQAMLGQVEQVIGRVHLMVMDALPTPTATIVVQSSPMALDEARAAVPFNFGLPTYLPAGLLAKEQVFVTKLDIPIVKIRWQDSAGGFVQLGAFPYSTENSLIPTRVGPQSSQTILINGQEAVIVYGAWDQASRTWSYQDQVVTLIWDVGDIQYHLLAVSQVVPLSELIAMAQSVQ